MERNIRNIKRLNITGLLLAIGLLGGGQAQAGYYSLDITDFATHPYLSPASSSSTDGPNIVDSTYTPATKMLRMTPDGVGDLATSVFANGIHFGSGSEVHTSFDFAMHRGDSPSQPADGMAFVIRNASSSPLGQTGSGLGYAGIANALVFEFDSFGNNVDDVAGGPSMVGASPHIAIKTTDGSGTASLVFNAALQVGSYGGSNAFSNNDVWHASIDIIGDATSGNAWVRMAVSDTNAPGYIYSLGTSVLDIAGVLNLSNGSLVGIGFTASTGDRYSEQDILNWHMTVPEPASMALVAVALGAASLRRRKVQPA